MGKYFSAFSSTADAPARSSCAGIPNSVSIIPLCTDIDALISAWKEEYADHEDASEKFDRLALAIKRAVAEADDACKTASKEKE